MVRALAVAFVIVSCASSSKGVSPPAGLVAAPMMDVDGSPALADIGAGGGVTTKLDDVPYDAGPKLCGCGLCDPIVSTDRCRTDADCGPTSPCHATACVAKAKSAPRTPGIMCTEDMRCATADANACGCYKGFCALYKK